VTVSRRGFLGTVGAVGAGALALKLGLFDAAASVLGETPAPAGAPRVRAAFLRPKAEKYWMGWPGAAYDLAGHQKEYAAVLRKAAAREGVALAFAPEPLWDGGAVGAFMEGLKADPPDGVILLLMDMNRWGDVNAFVEKRGPVPTVVFSPMGTSFTGHLGPTARAKQTFVAATQDVAWLETAVHLFQTMARMRATRICIASGDKTADQTLEVLGTTVHYIPRARFPEELAKVQESPEAKALAAYYTKEARRIVEPNAADILNAAENYLACRRLMEAEKCQAISMDCLGLVGSRQIPCPPCIAFSRLLDEGLAGVCEADVGAALSLMLSSYLCGRPGFMQDPAPNTVHNTLMGAHCTCPTKLDGFDRPHEPFCLRSHSESDIGVSPQVLWRLGQKVTLMRFEGPGAMLIGTGRVLANIDTPPSGGCRTSVELAVDDVPDSRNVKGFHQVFLYGDWANLLQAYCQLAGVSAVHI
jgi:hypothetical protein